MFHISFRKSSLSIFCVCAETRKCIPIFDREKGLLENATFPIEFETFLDIGKFTLQHNSR